MMTLTDDQVSLGFQKMNETNQNINLKLKSELKTKQSNLESLLELFKCKESFETALEFSKKVASINNNKPETNYNLKLLQSQLESQAETKRLLKNYRLYTEEFRELLLGVLKPSERSWLNYQKALKDWAKIRLSAFRSSFFDLDMVKNFVILHCMFEICDYYYSIRANIVRLLNKWQAKNLLLSDPESKSVLLTFLNKGEGEHTKHKKLTLSQADLETNHSSNQKVNNLQECLGKRQDISQNQTLLLPNLTRVKLVKEETSQPTANSQSLMFTSQNSSPLASTSIKVASSELLHPSPPNSLGKKPFLHNGAEFIDLELEDNNKRQEEIAPLKSELLSAIDNARREARSVLFCAFMNHCHFKLALGYAGKFEAEVFSQHHGCLSTYEKEVKKCAEIISSISQNESIFKTIQTVSFDYELIINHDQASTRKVKSSSLPMPDGSDPSLLEIPLEAIQRVTDLQDFDTAESIETDSFELIEAMYKLKEKESNSLKSTIASMSVENEKLKLELLKIRSGLTKLNSGL